MLSVVISGFFVPIHRNFGGIELAHIFVKNEIVNLTEFWWLVLGFGCGQICWWVGHLHLPILAVTFTARTVLSDMDLELTSTFMPGLSAAMVVSAPLTLTSVASSTI